MGNAVIKQDGYCTFGIWEGNSAQTKFCDFYMFHNEVEHFCMRYLVSIANTSRKSCDKCNEEFGLNCDREDYEMVVIRNCLEQILDKNYD